MKHLYTLSILLLSSFSVLAQSETQVQTEKEEEEQSEVKSKLEHTVLIDMVVTATPSLESSQCRIACEFPCDHQELKKLESQVDSTVATIEIETLKLFPVPANHTLNVDFQGLENPSELRIVDMNGRVIRVASQFSAEQCQVDVSSFVPGFYCATLVNSKGEMRSAKFVVAH